MARSKEYPDLAWVEPRSWRNANRAAVQLVVIHTTEGSSHAGSAEDGAAYDARRADGTSTHYFHDSDSTVQCVRTEDIAHTARTQGNLRGIQHELCARASWSAGTWEAAYAQAMLRRAAKQAARDCRKWNIPVRHLPAAEVASGVRGFCGHADISRAFPQDQGTHTDPGPRFPWSDFLDMVRAELAPPPTEWSEMATQDEIQEAAKRGALQALAQVVPYVGSDTSGPRSRIKGKAGWNDLSVNGKLDYLLELVARVDDLKQADAVYPRLDNLEETLAEVTSGLAEIKTLLAEGAGTTT